MTATDTQLQHLGLNRNPFPPATTGTGFVDDLSLPSHWEEDLRQRIRQLAASQGDKALVIVGGYGSGKSFILNWIQATVLPDFRVKSFLFENPGVAFYDLANHLMRQVGRYEVAKALWEMLYTPNEPEAAGQLHIPLEFGDWLGTLNDRIRRDRAIRILSQSMKGQGLATDEEILNKLSRLIVETGERPYFEYRDFVPRSSRSLVAEREEPQYFQTLVKILGRILNADGIAFLLDEFEDVALARQLNRNQAAAYTATLRRLLDVAKEEDLWIILSTTPEGLDRTLALDESFIERFSHPYIIPELSEEDAYNIVEKRLQLARNDGGEGLYPFDKDALKELAETSRSSPRRLIKIMWHAIGLAVERAERAPLSGELVKEAEQQLYPGVVKV
ncbi:MAG: hypothetical protein OXH72_00105 [Caldilineaceae bacterium]|nr:hypothetical protein [Caldilineaceae bacterium]